MVPATTTDNPHAWLMLSMTPEQFEQQARLAYENVRPATFAPYMLGFFVDACLLGTIIVLVGVWSKTTRPTERRILRYLVYWSLFVSLIASGWMVAQVMHVLAEGFGVYSHVREFTFLRYFGLISMSSRIPVSLFLMHRAYKLTGERRWVILAISPLLMLIAGMSVASVITLRSMADITQSKLFLAVSSASEVLSDMILTTTIAVKLWRSRTGWENTDRLISRLLLVLAETQLPPALLALVFLIISTTLPRQSTQFILLFHPKVPIVCLLVVLISRTQIENSVKKGSQTSASSQVRGQRSKPKSPITPRSQTQRFSTYRPQSLPYGPAYDDYAMSPIAPTRLDTVEEDKTDASVRSGVTDEHKETGLGDSRVALVAKAL